MSSQEVLTLDTTLSRIETPQSGDFYLFPTGITSVLITGDTATLGKLGVGTDALTYHAEITGATNVGSLYIAGTEVTSSAAELNYCDITAAGTVQASKAVVVDSGKSIGTFGGISGDTLSAGQYIKLGGTDITASAAEINILDTAVAGTVVASKAVVVDSDKSIGTFGGVSGDTIYAANRFYTGGDSNWQGNYMLNEQGSTNLRANAMPAPYLYLDGVNDYMNLDLLAAELVNTSNTKGTIVWHGKIHDFTTNYLELWTFGDTDADELIEFANSATDYKLQLTCKVAGTSQWAFSTDNTFSEDIEYIIIVIQNGTEPKLYINAVLEPITFFVSTNKTSWFHETTGIDNGRIGSLRWNSGAESQFGNISVSYFDVWNYDWTAAEVKGFQNGSIPDKYQGANQTECITAQENRDFNIASNWTNSNMATYDETDDLTITSNAGNQYCYLSSSFHTIDQVGKRYRLTVTASGLSGDAFEIGFNVGGQWDLVTGEILTGTNSYEFTLLADHWFRITSIGTGGITLDNFSVIQIGCLAEYPPDGIDIANSVWHDKQQGKDGIIIGPTCHNELPILYTNKQEPGTDERIVSNNITESGTQSEVYSINEAGKMRILSSGVTASEFMILSGLTSSAAELNVLDGVTAGSVTASKGIVVDSDKSIGTFGGISGDTLSIGTQLLVDGVIAGGISLTTGSTINYIDTVSAVATGTTHTIPALCDGYITINVNGEAKQIPYFTAS